MKKIVLSILVLLITLGLHSQNAKVKQGDRQFALHNFAKAASLWQKAFQNTKNEQEKRLIAFRIGSAMHRMNRFEDALQWYDDALAEDASKPEWLLAKADALLRSGNTDDARLTAERVLIIQPYSAEAKKIVTMAKAYKNALLLAAPIPLTSAEGINTKWSDYAASWLNNDLVISSSRPSNISNDADGRTSEHVSALYLYIANLYGDYGEPIELPLNENYNAGTFTIDHINSRIFFTKCNNRKQRCMIMEATFDPESFSFGRAKPAAFVQKKYHYGHPFVSEDGTTIYFSAKLPGGYGGNDIYKISMKQDGSFGLPINLGPSVNTGFDEVFPTAAGDSVLFFSSYGHIGYGGLDIYYSKMRNGEYNNIALLPPPFNGPSDDFSLHLRPGTSKGLLTSSRNRINGDDIYFFDGYPIQKMIKGIVIDAQTKVPIANAAVLQINPLPIQKTVTGHEGAFKLSITETPSLLMLASHPDFLSEEKKISQSMLDTLSTLVFSLNRKNNPVKLIGKVTDRETGKAVSGQEVTITGAGGYLAMTRTASSGLYSFDSVVADRIYTISIEKEGYFGESRVIRLPEVKMPTIFQKSSGYDLDFELTRIIIKKEITLNDIFYDFDKAGLRESSKTELLKLVSMMRNTPQVRIKISSHTDTRGSHAYNDRLSADRAKSVVDYLVQSGISPLRLEAQGFGKRFPLFASAKTENEHQANRRTTFQVIDLNAAKNDDVKVLKEVQSGLSYRVQLLVSSTPRNTEESFGALKQLLGALEFYETVIDGAYRYEAGTRYNLSEAEALRNGIRAAGFIDAFIVPYINQQRVTLQQARDYQP